MEGAVGYKNGQAAESKLSLVKLKSSEEESQQLRKELRDNKTEYLDHYYILARATEE